MDRITAPTHSFISRTKKERHICQRHSQHISNDEISLITQVRDARRRDIRRWWEDSSKYLLHSPKCHSACKFRKLYTDPQTKKFLFPSHVKNIIYHVDKEKASLQK